MKSRLFFFTKGIGKLILIVTSIALGIALLNVIGYWTMTWGINPMYDESVSVMPETYGGRIALIAFMGFIALLLYVGLLLLILAAGVLFYLGILRLGGCPADQMFPVFAPKKSIKLSQE